MLTSLAFIFLVGLAMASITQAIKLPRIIGMLVTGIVLGPYVLDLLDSQILGISAELRQIALIIILIKAGLSLNIGDLKKVGRPAILMSFLPACFEIAAYAAFAPIFLGIEFKEALLMGSVLAAVSPAVVVPRMVSLIEAKRGTQKAVPQMIMAGASCDDVFVIVLFGAFLGMAQGNEVNLTQLFNIPVSIVLGIIIGVCFGFGLSFLFEFAFRHGRLIRNSTKVILILGVSFLLMAIQNWLDGFVSVSGLLAVIAMACVLKIRSTDAVSKRLSEKFGKLWLAAEVILFVLVGAAVDIRYTFEAGLSAIAMIFAALIFRAVAVLICVSGTKLNIKERLFCVIAYMPKATVQAAIGSAALAAGLPCGKIILSVAVLSILITAPLGAIGIDLTSSKLLENNA